MSEKSRELPTEFNEYESSIDLSKKPYIKIVPELARSVGLFSSKFRGTPFLPHGNEYPRDKDGMLLVLLAQINFEEVPKLEGFPDSGILQFFIQAGMNSKHIWGMNIYNKEPWDPTEYFEKLRKQDYFRVIYYPKSELEESQSRSPYRIYNGHDIPISDQMRLKFSIEYEYVNIDDYQFSKYFGLDAQDFHDKHENVGWEVLDRFYRSLNVDAPAKMGGYGRFVQGDPREVAPEGEDWLVLLNIDSVPVGNSEILWGDAGIATFMIEASDLMNLDFTRVAYYWDNH